MRAKDVAAFHHQLDPLLLLEYCDICLGVTVNYDQVGQFADFQGSYRMGYAYGLSGVFGAGDDLRTWSPATSYRIATIDYGLTPDGVKKFILNLLLISIALKSFFVK